MKKRLITTLLFLASTLAVRAEGWIRINQLGYLPQSTKVAVLMSTEALDVQEFTLEETFSGKEVWRSSAIRATGPMGMMAGTWRLDFSAFTGEGSYRLCAGGVKSQPFPVKPTVYDGTADFVLNYMRQQRCGFNPYLKDSCHKKDGIIIYHPDKTGQYLDVRGGWHDASDCLQYSTTSANAVYQMMVAYKANPQVFTDRYDAMGLPGANGIPDIVDEIKWGMDWLLRMNPGPREFYNQLADDRDHVGMRLPPEDQADYDWGPGGARPVYFVTGQPQMRGRKTGRMNSSTGVSSITAKFSSDYALGASILEPYYPEYAAKLRERAAEGFVFGEEKPGYSQTASVLSPYIYEETNWVDDMELAGAELFRLTGERKYLDKAVEYGRMEPVTPWMGADSALHYQWYPFMNMGHALVAELGNGRVRAEFIRNLRSGIDRTWQKAKDTPFMNGIPGIWCSNNLTVAMLTQCILYRELSGDRSYELMEGALRDWLFGCNPWGVSMIVELPRGGVYPTQAHSCFVVLKKGNTTGGLVDGPVYSTIFGSLKGVTMEGGIDYELFQPGDRVYHDSVHDYSTNEPTMDGTASLTFPLSYYQSRAHAAAGLANETDKNVWVNGGIIRRDPSQKRITLVFTADDMADGADRIIRTLKKEKIKGAFFFTGKFYELYPDIIRRLLADGHYVGSHSYGHLLYMPWENRDSLLVSREEFVADMRRSYAKMAEFGIEPKDAPYFIPPYEYYNSTIASWAKDLGLQVINFTPGTGSNGDYTTPDMKNYMSNKYIWDRIMKYEKEHTLNGHFMLIHFGTSPLRTEKFYDMLPDLIKTLRKRGYSFDSL